MPKSRALAALVILTALNFFNYIDRNVLFSVQLLIKEEFHCTDTQLGFLTTAFFLGYVPAAFVAGYLADRYRRRPVIVIGALVWSAATLLTAATHDYQKLLVRHIIVGVGEATFVAIAPSFICDMFSEERRGRMMAVFCMAIPVGSALGAMIGGYFGAKYGWRVPFYIGAAPGFVLALAMLLIPEPQRGAADTIANTSERGTLRGLFSNGAYWTATLGMGFMTFALGGLQVWMPTFLSSVRGYSIMVAGIAFGGIILFDGITASIFGGWLGDRLLRRDRGAHYVVSAVSLALGIPAILVALYTSGTLMFAGILIGGFLLLVNTAPLNAAVVNAVDARIRASAMAVNLFTIHLVGDALSPVLIPLLAKRYGGLQSGFLSAVIAIAAAVAILLVGKRFAPRITILEDPQRRGVTA